MAKRKRMVLAMERIDRAVMKVFMILATNKTVMLIEMMLGVGVAIIILAQLDIKIQRIIIIIIIVKAFSFKRIIFIT